jgi:hypothetical protein
VKEYIEFIKLYFLVLMIVHLMACIWIYIGKSSRGGWVQVYLNDFEGFDLEVNLEDYMFEHKLTIFINSFYYIAQTITTVGYGDVCGNTG